MSYAPRTSGWIIPKTPTSLPWLFTTACRPLKKVGTSDGAHSYDMLCLASTSSPEPLMGTPSTSMIRLRRPWMISKPLSFPQYTAQILLSFIAPTSISSVSNTMSPTSNSFIGSGASLLDASVLRAPGRRLVRHTSNSAVAGLPMLTASPPLSGLRMLSKFSAREMRIQVSTSVKPAVATSVRMRSHSWLSGSSLPCVTVGGMRLVMLLKP
mmetsp:Transcript_24158/g.67183  ORF Transcript_24158/g.67183 Transcript_24158/m.67183 type:complete len:211 (+) Transcript_24158:187-819(+)